MPASVIIASSSRGSTTKFLAVLLSIDLLFIVIPLPFVVISRLPSDDSNMLDISSYHYLQPAYAAVNITESTKAGKSSKQGCH